MPPNKSSSKQALAMAYATKRSAMAKRRKAEGGMVDAKRPMEEMGERDESPRLAEGGEVNDERSLDTSPNSPNHELDASMEATERSEFPYGQSSQDGSSNERDLPRESLSLSLIDDIMMDRKRRGLSNTQPSDNNSSIPDKEYDKAWVQSEDGMYAMGGKVSSDSMKSNVSVQSMDAMHAKNRRGDDHDQKRQHMDLSHENLPSRVQKGVRSSPMSRNDQSLETYSMGGSVESYEDDSESSDVGQLGGPIDEPRREYLSNNSDEVNPSSDDGRESRGINLEPVHEMTDPMHDQDSASKDSDYEDNDDSLIGEILRDRRRMRRE